MSISLELSRIQTDKNTIRNKLIELGLATSTDNLDKLATAIAGIIDRGTVSGTVVEGDTFVIEPGYHRGGTVSAIAGGGNYKLQEKGPITPTKQQQNITADAGNFGLSKVLIAPIPDAYQDVSSVTATAEDVLANKSIVRPDGTITPGEMPNIGAINKTLDVNTITVTIDKGFHNGNGKVTITLDEKSVTPSKSEQKITPTSGKVLKQVIVAPIPDKYQDVSKVDAVASDVKTGKTIVDAEGNVVPGEMPDNGDVSDSFDGLTNASCTIPAGYTSGGTISLTNDIENALKAI